MIELYEHIYEIMRHGISMKVHRDHRWWIHRIYHPVVMEINSWIVVCIYQQKWGEKNELVRERERLVFVLDRLISMKWFRILWMKIVNSIRMVCCQHFLHRWSCHSHGPMEDKLIKLCNTWRGTIWTRIPMKKNHFSLVCLLDIADIHHRHYRKVVIHEIFPVRHFFVLNFSNENLQILVQFVRMLLKTFKLLFVKVITMVLLLWWPACLCNNFVRCLVYNVVQEWWIRLIDAYRHWHVHQIHDVLIHQWIPINHCHHHHRVHHHR